MRALSPLATLERGYAVLQDAAGHVVTSVDQPSPGDPLRARVRDGTLVVEVRDREPTDSQTPAPADEESP